MRTVIIALLLLSACGSGPQPAFAGDYVAVHLYLVRDSEGLTECQAVQAWEYARIKFADVGIKLQIVSFREVTDLPEGEWRYALKDQYLRLWESQKWLRRNKLDTPWEIHYFFYPPIFEGGAKLFGGIAQSVCDFARGGVAVGQAGAWSSHDVPLSRLDASGMICAHEICHLLGCEHKDAPTLGNWPINIMDSAAGRFIDAFPMVFLPVSVTEMRGCMGYQKSRALKACRRKVGAAKRRCKNRIKRKAPVLRSGSVVDSGFYFE